LAADIENSHHGRPKFDIKHRTYVTNAILSAVSFLEAAINELFQDAFDRRPNYIGGLTEELRAILADYWEMTELSTRPAISLLDKYQLALRFAGQEPLDKGRRPYQDVDLLV
jgi:hypothetical protein